VRTLELAKMFHLEDTYWWFVARRRLVGNLVARYRPRQSPLRILDVGCGTGATLGVLSEYGEVTGVDSSRDALRFCRQRGHRNLVLAQAERLPVLSESVDVITGLDLLEHIPDDGAAVRELARALRPGGLLVITVPAYPFLWSEHDEALSHIRRYRARRLRHLLEGADLRVERLSPLITSLLPAIAALRLLQRLRLRKRGDARTAYIEPPRSVNRLLTWLLGIESAWLIRFNLPVGVSLLAVARKQHGSPRQGRRSD
jgi:SAM-dependent methyltransferase